MSHLALLKHQTQAIKNPPPTFQTVSRRRILRSSHPGSCINGPRGPRGWRLSAATPRELDLHVVVLDDYAGSWFIVDSSNTVIVSVMVEEKGKQAEERQDEPRLWRPWRPPRRRMGWRVLWAVGMVVALLTTALLIVHLHPEIWKGLLEERNLTLIAIGVSVMVIIVLLAIGGAASSWTGFRGKTVWDLLQLLIVPLALAVIGLWFAAQQDARQQQIENQRAEAERKLVQQRAQDEALQT